MQSLPQFFGQSFSSSSFVNPSGQVVSSSVYTDTEGNLIVDGRPQSAVAISPVVAKPQSQPKPQQQTVPKKVESGQYIPDDRGKYKGN